MKVFGFMFCDIGGFLAQMFIRSAKLEPYTKTVKEALNLPLNQTPVTAKFFSSLVRLLVSRSIGHIHSLPGFGLSVGLCN